MSDNAMAVIAAGLWELRARCEQEMQALADAQAMAAELRDSRLSPALLRERLVGDLQSVLRTNGMIRDGALDCMRRVGQLPLHDA